MLLTFLIFVFWCRLFDKRRPHPTSHRDLLVVLADSKRERRKQKRKLKKEKREQGKRGAEFQNLLLVAARTC
jgi:hypothetical protein